MSDREMRRCFNQVEREERLEKISTTYGQAMQELVRLKKQISDLEEWKAHQEEWTSFEADMSPNHVADMYYAEAVGGARP